VYLDKILSIINNITIPDYDKDGNHVKNNTFSINPIKDEDVKFSFNETENSMYLEVDDLGA